jgi:hypothetical protein
MVRHNQLSEWQKNSLSRSPHLYNSWYGAKLAKAGHKRAILESYCGSRRQRVVCLCSASGLKLVPFVVRTSARKTKVRHTPSASFPFLCRKQALLFAWFVL